jgi:hypothetical protein
VLITIGLGFLLPDQLRVGDRWTVLACEIGLLLALVVTTPRPPRREEEHPARRYIRVVLVGIVSAVNVLALFLLARLLVNGGGTDPRALIEGGAVLWTTLVLLFAIWFWELDRGGPVRRMLHDEGDPDFLFQEMSDGAEFAGEHWRPHLRDYLYLSLANAASFSPAESWPLSGRAKLLMAAQTVGSLVTTTVILSYAINGLAGGSG